jgi:hypothetical protein
MSKHSRAQIRAPRAAEAFVRQQAKERPANQSTSRPDDKRRAIVVRPSGKEQDKITAYLPVELGSWLRGHCAIKRKELSVAIAEAIVLWRKEQDE